MGFIGGAGGGARLRTAGSRGLSAVLGGQLGLPSRQPVLAGVLSLVFGAQTEALDKLEARLDLAGRDAIARGFQLTRLATISFQQINQVLNLGRSVYENILPDSWIPAIEKMRTTVSGLTDQAIAAQRAGAFIGAQFGPKFLAIGGQVGLAFGAGLEAGNLLQAWIDHMLGPDAFTNRLADIWVERASNFGLTNGRGGFRDAVALWGTALSGAVFDVFYAAATTPAPTVPPDYGLAERLSVRSAAARTLRRATEYAARNAARRRLSEEASAPSNYIHVATPVHESAVLAEIQMRLAHVIAADEAAAGIP